MRLFVAIELDEAARAAIASEQSRLRQALEERIELKWVRPEHVHLTLAFLGELTEDSARRVVDVLEQPVRHHRFSVGFGGLGVFPHRGAPRVLWLGVRRGAREVAAVHREVFARLSRAGIALEERAFHPHLTLARWRKPRESDRQRVLRADLPREVTQIDVADVTLVESRLSPTGPAYHALCRARLEQNAPPPLQSLV